MEPKAGLAIVFGAQSSKKAFMCFKRAIFVDGVAQRVAFHEMTSGMLVAFGFGAIECVINHGPAQKGCGERMFALH